MILFQIEIFFFYFGITYGCNDTRTEIDLIVDYLDLGQSRNVAITAYVCWTKELKFELLNKLVNNDYFGTVLDLDENFIQNSYPNYKQIYILDLDCTNYSRILKTANNNHLFSPPNQWFLLSKTPITNYEINKKIIQFDFGLNSHVNIARKISINKYLLTDIYKLNKSSNNFIINNWCFWTKKKKFINSKQLPKNRLNLNGTILKAAIVILDQDTLNHLTDYRDKHIDAITKINYILIKHLTDFLNGTLEIYPVDSWGYLNISTNLFTGMIGYLQKNYCEIGGTALFMTKDRVPIIDYLSMTTPTKIRFVFRQPPLSYEKNIFTLPFSKGLWISSFCLVMLASLLLYLTVLNNFTSTNYLDSPQNSILDAVMLTFAAVAQQGSNFEPKNASGKIIMISTFIALMFLYVSYSANIVAILQSSATNIRTLEDLLESRLKLGADDTVYNRYYMSTATEPIRKSIYEKKIAPIGATPHFTTLEEGVKRIRGGFYAFHMELGRGYKLIADTFYENEKCGLQEIDYLGVVDAYIAVKKNSSYKEIFTLGLRKLREAGIQNREILKIYSSKPECLRAIGNFVTVGIIDCYPAFIFLGAGLAISILLFALEHFCNKYINRICLKLSKK